MFAAAVGYLRNRLNDRLVPTGSSEDEVLLSSISQADGTMVPEADQKLMMFVLNIERDVMPGSRGAALSSGSSVLESHRPLHFNIYTMVASCAAGKFYAGGLEKLSKAAAFFQSHPVFDHANSPDLDPRIDRLTLQIENVELSTVSHLWGVLGGSYRPSLLYKVRMVTIDDDAVIGEVPTIRQPQDAELR